MSISILVPTYRRPEQLKEALHSIAVQDLTCLAEVIVGDDSNDELAAENEKVIAASPLGPLVRYVRHVPPKGNYPNQWALAEMAVGQFVLVLHDDDLLCEGALEQLYRAASTEAEPGVAVWFGRNLIMDENGTVDFEQSRIDMARYGKGGETAVKPMWEWSLSQALPPNGFLVLKEHYLQNMSGDRDGNVGDWWLSVRLANRGLRGRFLAFDASKYRVQVESNTNSGTGTDVHRMYEAAKQLQVPRDPQAQDLYKKLLAKFARGATTRYIRDGERLRAARLMLSPDWGWGVRLSRRGLATFLMLLTPSVFWRWAIRHK